MNLHSMLGSGNIILQLPLLVCVFLFCLDHKQGSCACRFDSSKLSVCWTGALAIFRHCVHLELTWRVEVRHFLFFYEAFRFHIY